jgi:hypothetical protein
MTSSRRVTSTICRAGLRREAMARAGYGLMRKPLGALAQEPEHVPS